MNLDYYNKNLEENEEIIKVVRQHPIVLIKPVFWLGLLILLDFFLITWLFAKGLWGVLVFVLVLTLPSLLIMRSWVIWKKNMIIITTKRVIDIDQHTLFHKVVSECNYRKIQDVSFKVKGIFATIFNFGQIQIQTAGNQANLEIRNIKNPNEIQEIITDAQRQDLKNKDKNIETDLQEAVDKIKSRLDDETIKKLFKPDNE
ncbi:MAG: PH domain-containing protein [Patescibacteria group bacterium]|nr:PH domain-containing protein [Patescibacteria group bacterium]